MRDGARPVGSTPPDMPAPAPADGLTGSSSAYPLLLGALVAVGLTTPSGNRAGAAAGDQRPSLILADPGVRSASLKRAPHGVTRTRSRSPTSREPSIGCRRKMARRGNGRIDTVTALLNGFELATAAAHRVHVFNTRLGEDRAASSTVLVKDEEVVSSRDLNPRVLGFICNVRLTPPIGKGLASGSLRVPPLASWRGSTACAIRQSARAQKRLGLQPRHHGRRPSRRPKSPHFQQRRSPARGPS